MRILTVATSCTQLPTIYKLMIFGILALILIASLQTGPVDFKEHWDNFRNPTKDKDEDDRIGGGMPIRLMYVGASMTLGEHSTGERGYREQVRNWLVKQGNEVNCVGQNRYGDFLDNDVQAFGAQPIEPTLDRLKDIVPQTQPNLILINAGSSDCFQPVKFGSGLIHQKMRHLVDYMFEASPRATIILSTIIPSPWDGVEACVKSSNAQIRQVAYDLIRLGKPVSLVEMHYDQGLPGRVELKHIGKDDMHPIDKGYFIMGDLFIEAIQEVSQKGWLQQPIINGIANDGEAERHAEELKQKEQEKEKKPEEAKKKEDEKKSEEKPARRRRKLGN